MNSYSGGFILLSGNVLEVLLTFRQNTPYTPEAGGVLLGKRRGKHLEITDLTTPYPRDIRKRKYFDRKDYRHARYAHKQWNANNRMIGYVGEWHTHPERWPHPSMLDIKEWLKLSRPYTDELVFLIIGVHDIWAGVGGLMGLHNCRKSFE